MLERETMITPVMRARIGHFGDDVQRINNALKVHGSSCLIAGETGLDEAYCRVVALAGLLHDIGIRKAERTYGPATGKNQEREGPPIARRFLSFYVNDPATTERVCFIVANHHPYAGIDGVDFQTAIEADSLVNVFEDSLRRNAIKRTRKTMFRTGTETSLLEALYLHDPA